MKQQYLFCDPSVREFGGETLKGKRKTGRPICTKRSIHLVLKASNSYSLLKSKAKVDGVIRKWSQHFGIRVYALAVNADHVHFHVRVPNREVYPRWIRTMTSRLVSLVRGLKFIQRPYSRLVNWGRDARRLRDYFVKNRFEAELIGRAWLIARTTRRLFAQAASPQMQSISLPRPCYERPGWPGDSRLPQACL